MTADDTETHGQAHSSAGLSFGREERIEKSLLYVRSHAGTRVSDIDHDAFAVFLCGDTHFAAGRHGVDSVVDHIDQHLAQFHWIAFDVSLAVGMKSKANRSEFRAGLPARSRHLASILKQFSNRDNLKLAARALTGEILNTANDVGAVFSAFDDQLQAGF